MSNKGRFVWYDLMTNDVEGAKAFYTETIGWKTQPWDGPMPYTMWLAGETPIGGVTTLPDEVKKMGVPPHWLAYVRVDDVDAAAKKAAELGGKIRSPGMDIPEVGRFAVISDPQGATLALFAPKGEDMPRPSRDQQGVFSWHELNTTDWEGAWKFYSKLFGWVESMKMDMGEGMGTYFMYKHPADGENASLGGMSNVAKQMNMPPHWLYYATVDSCDAAVKRITSKGGKVLNGPMEVPGGGHIAQCMDPQGAAFAVYAEKK